MQAIQKLTGPVLLVGAAALLVACAPQVREDAAVFDRNEAVASLLVEIDEVGYNDTENGIQVSPGVDQVLNGINSILIRQRSVIQDYRARAENFPDVTAFMMAYQEADAAEFSAAVQAFDTANPDDPIRPKIDAYEQAGEEIYAANSELTSQITQELAALGILLARYSTQVAEATAVSGALSFMARMRSTDEDGEKITHDPDTDLGAALVRARHQLRLSREASRLINEEKALIEEVLRQEQRFQLATEV